MPYGCVMKLNVKFHSLVYFKHVAEPVMSQQ